MLLYLVLVVLLLLVLWAVVLLPGRAANFIWQCLRPCFCLWFRWWCWWWRCCCAVGGGAATRPGCQFHAVTLTAVLLLLISMVCLSVFGLVVGTFSWGNQIWAAPLKIVSGLMFSAAICLPSLYIFTCIGGLEAKFSSVVGMLCAIVALSGLLLVGFAPVVWLFSVSSTSAVFIGFMLLALWLISVGFGFSLVFRAGKAMGMTNTGHLFVWCLIFLLVTIQMTTTLRPIVGESDLLFNFSEKKFFLQYRK